MKTKRAVTMLPYYSGEVEEHEHWRFQMVRFFFQEPYFVQFFGMDRE